MEQRKILLYLLLSFVILNSVVLIYLANFRLIVFNERFYKKEFVKNDVYSDIAAADDELNSLFLFLKGKGSLDKEFFGEDERAHLADVKILISKTIILFYFLIFTEVFLFISLYYLLRKGFVRHAKFALLCAAGAVLLVSILLFAFSDSFQRMFIKFHGVFFPQGNWLFPAGSSLILLFPNQFFYDSFYRILSNSFIVALIAFVVGLLPFSDEK